jgi:hydrocephalus-inducing protein
VNVNAVFSKYSIVPLKNINFGPMRYGEQVTRSFEIRNEGLFDFKFAICDYKDQDAKQRIREQREKEMNDRINGAAEEQKEDPKAKAKKPDPKAKPKGKGAKEEPPEGGLLEVSQYSITPAQGDIAVGSSAVVNVTFKAEGAKFYENVLAIDVSGRDPQDQPEGIPFEICAESSIPGINATDMD